MARWRKRLRGVTGPFYSLALLFFVLPKSAQSQVNIWARAKQPELGFQHALLVQADRGRLPRGELFEGTDSLDDRLLHKLAERSALALELAGVRANRDADAAYLLAECWASAAQPERAEGALRRALELAPDHAHAASAWRWLAVGYFRSGRFASVSAAAQQALEREANPRVRGQLYVLAGFGQVLSNKPLSAQHWFEFGLNEAVGGAEWALNAWGLALQRDLERDVTGALEQAAHAGSWQGNEGEQALETPLGELLPLAVRAYLRGLLLLAQAERGEEKLKVSRRSAAQLMFLTYREAAETGVLLERAQQHSKQLAKQLQLQLSDDLDREALRPMDLSSSETAE